MDRNGYNKSLICDGYCFFCGNPETVRHEIFQGKNRSNSKKYGLWLTVCPACHRMIHEDSAVSNNLKQLAQEIAMASYNWETEDFRKVFGKNYL